MKQCYKCFVVLTEDNKIKGKNMCKACNIKKCHEYYEKNIQPSKIAKREEKLKTVKKCVHCDEVLTDDNVILTKNFILPLSNGNI